MKYLAVLGRLPDLSRAELEALYHIKTVSYLPPSTHPRYPRPAILVFELPDGAPAPDLSRLGGTIKLARELDLPPLDYLRALPDGKIVLGVSDYSAKASGSFARDTAMNLKKKLTRQAHRSIRVVNTNTKPALSSATSHHNRLGGKPTHVELIHFSDNRDSNKWFLSLGTQNITAYARRDQARPARDAKVGMLPPKLAQILINLCGPLGPGSRLLDPFCGTGVVLQEALLMGYAAMGTDLNRRMIEYSGRNLEWLSTTERCLLKEPVSRRGEREVGEPCNDRRDRTVRKWTLSVGDATTFKWTNIDAVACETYLGPPLSNPPSDMRLKEIKHECRTIILGFLKNLAPQLASGTPVVLAIPAWLRPDGTYSGLDILDEIAEVGYNVIKYNVSDGKPLLYYREGQVVAREIIVLRKK